LSSYFESLCSGDGDDLELGDIKTDAKAEDALDKQKQAEKEPLSPRSRDEPEEPADMETGGRHSYRVSPEKVELTEVEVALAD